MKEAAGLGAAKGSTGADELDVTGGAGGATRSKFCQGMSEPPKDDFDCRRLPVGDFAPEGARVGV